jgi:Heavy metal binding domain
MKAIALLFAAALATASPVGQPPAKPKQATAANPRDLPPLSYICIMPGDEDVLEDHPGKCPKPGCGMDLHPVRLDSVWTCPVHGAIHESKPGKCPIDKRDLIQVTMVISWTCAGTSVDSVNPGACADGTPMVKKFSPRAHGNHNPQHGGQFFMAPDSWHHIEGAYLPSGVFRLYLYDDYTKPLKLTEARKINARVVTKQAFDAANGTTNEFEKFPLVLKGAYLEAQIGKQAWPARMSAKVTFKAGTPENLFDFAFEAFSKDPTSPVSAPRVTSAAPLPARKPASAAAAATPAGPSAGDSSSSVDAALIPLPIPDTVPEMLEQLHTRTNQIRLIIDRGAFASVYVPAFQAKDLALALDTRMDELPSEARKVAEPAILRLVRSAYLLDAFGDIGNKQQILEAYAVFTGAVKDIESAFPEARKP